jgi:hypothetical protein
MASRRRLCGSTRCYDPSSSRVRTVQEGAASQMSPVVLWACPWCCGRVWQTGVEGWAGTGRRAGWRACGRVCLLLVGCVHPPPCHRRLPGSGPAHGGAEEARPEEGPQEIPVGQALAAHLAAPSIHGLVFQAWVFVAGRAQFNAAAGRDVVCRWTRGLRQASTPRSEVPCSQAHRGGYKGTEYTDPVEASVITRPASLQEAIAVPPRHTDTTARAYAHKEKAWSNCAGFH